MIPSMYHCFSLFNKLAHGKRKREAQVRHNLKFIHVETLQLRAESETGDDALVEIYEGS